MNHTKIHRIVIVLGLLFILPQLCFAQQSNSRRTIDSLKLELEGCEDDSLRITLYRDLGRNYRAVNVDSAIIMLEKALDIPVTPRLHNPRGFVFSELSSTKLALKDSTAISAIKQAIVSFSMGKNVEQVVRFKNLLGYYYIRFDEYDKAIETLKVALKECRNTGFHKTRSFVHAYLGFTYTQKGQYDSAIVHQTQCMKYRELAGLTIDPATVLNIGVNYFHSGNFTKALEYYKQTAEEGIAQGNQQAETIAYQNMGAAYTELGDLDKAIEFLTKANERSIANNDSVAISIYHTSIGDIKRKEFDLDAALKSYQKAQSIFPKSGPKSRSMFVHFNLAKIYLDIAPNREPSTLPLAVRHGEMAFQLASETGQIKDKGECAEVLFSAYERLGQFEKSINYVKQHMAIKDSLLSEERIAAVAEVQTKYETEKKELEIELLSKDNELKNEKLDSSLKTQRKQRNLNVAVISGLLVSLVLVILLMRQVRRRKRANQELRNRNETISRQDGEKAILLKEIHHRVKNNLQVISSLLQLQSSHVSKDERAVLEEGQGRVMAMALIHEKLYQTDHVSEIDMKEYCKHLCRDISNVFAGRHLVKFNIEIDNIHLDIDTAVPVGLMINELVTNAFKYAFHQQEGQVNIAIKKEEIGIYKMTVADSGPGLPPDLNWRKSKGLGLRLINLLTIQLYGSVDYENNGLSTFLITFKDTPERKKTE